MNIFISMCAFMSNSVLGGTFHTGMRDNFQREHDCLTELRRQRLEFRESGVTRSSRA